MIIKNPYLAEVVDTNLIEFSNRHFDEPDKNFDYSRIIRNEDESIEVPDDILGMLDNFRVVINTRHVSSEEIQGVLNELKDVLKRMHLSYFHMQPLSKTGPVEIDLAFLEKLNTDIENISLMNVDLSKAGSEVFERYEDLDRLTLEKCNITNPELVSKVNKNTTVSLARNVIAPEHFDKAVKLAQESKGGVIYSGELSVISKAGKDQIINLSDYLKFKDTVDFSKFSKLKVIIDLNEKAENQDEIIDVLNATNNVAIESDIDRLKMLDPDGKLKLDTRVVIKNASELSLDDIEKHANIKSVRMQDGENTYSQQGEPYEIETYKKAREEIDKIISEVDFPDMSDPDREKKIFAQIYKALGKKIRYNYYAISEEGEKDASLQISCRNLSDGLLKGTAVCAGYADILRNTLACAGIYSEYISGNINFEEGETLNLEDPQGHAWNKVRLDGEDYWTDLTWDADNILAGRYPLNYCLKSTPDFGHKRYKVGINNEKWIGCDKTISDAKQLELFEGIMIEKENPETKVNEETEPNNDDISVVTLSPSSAISLLSSLSLAVAQKGLTAGKLQVVSKEAELAYASALTTKKEAVANFDESDREE